MGSLDHAFENREVEIQRIDRNSARRVFPHASQVWPGVCAIRMTIASQVGQRTTIPGASAYTWYTPSGAVVPHPLHRVCAAVASKTKTSDRRPAAALPSSRRDSGVTARSFRIAEPFDSDGDRWVTGLDEAVRHCLDERGGPADEDARPLVDGPDMLADDLRGEPAAQAGPTLRLLACQGDRDGDAAFGVPLQACAADHVGDARWTLRA